MVSDERGCPWTPRLTSSVQCVPLPFAVSRSRSLGLWTARGLVLVYLAGWLAGWSLARSWSSTSTLSPTAPPFLLATRNHNVYLTDSLPVPALWSYYGSSVDLHMPPVPPPFYVPFLEQIQISLVGRDKPGTSSMVSHRLTINISVRNVVFVRSSYSSIITIVKRIEIQRFICLLFTGCDISNV